MQQPAGFLYIKTAARAGFGPSFGGQHLVGRIHRVYADPQLGGHGAAARQRGAGGAGAFPDFGRQRGVQLFIERRRALGIQLDHSQTSCMDLAKLAP